MSSSLHIDSTTYAAHSTGSDRNDHKGLGVGWSVAQAIFRGTPFDTQILQSLGRMETYNGDIQIPENANSLFDACRIGLLPRAQRHLSEKERLSIKCSSVFVWDEHETGIRRWTDGKPWTASQVSRRFLTYREMECKRVDNNIDRQDSREATQPSND
jgi:hypothetical protein